MATVTRENIGLLNDKLTIKVNKEDYLPAFEKKLKEYGKTANIPGFRKGMVPAGMIKKMYGPSIFNEEVIRGVEQKLYNYLSEEKPDIFAQPLPLDMPVGNMDYKNPGEYAFNFEIGLKPEFSLPELEKASLTLHKVEVTHEMVTEEINRMQIKGGNMTEPEVVDNDENVLNVLFSESDEKGILVEGGIVKENSVLLKYFSEALQKQLHGKKKGDKIVFKMADSFPSDKLEMMLKDLGLDPADKSSAEKYFNAEIVKIGLVEKRELNEDFFNEIFPGKGIKTEEALREVLKEEIAQYWMLQSRNQLQDQLYHYLIDHAKMEFPENFLKRWLRTGGESPKTTEEVERDYPGFSNQLKWTLISDRIITDNKFEVSTEEIRKSMMGEVSRYFGNMNMGEDMGWLDSYLDRMMKDEKHVDSTYRRLITEKVFSWLEQQVKPAEKTVTPEELVGMQHHHHH